MYWLHFVTNFSGHPYCPACCRSYGLDDRNSIPYRSIGSFLNIFEEDIRGPVFSYEKQRFGTWFYVWTIAVNKTRAFQRTHQIRPLVYLKNEQAPETVFLLSLFSRLIEGPTKPLIQCLAELKRRDCEADHSPSSSTEVYIMRKLYASPPNPPSCTGQRTVCILSTIVFAMVTFHTALCHQVPVPTVTSPQRIHARLQKKPPSRTQPSCPVYWQGW
jgi:hypothetical protein